MFSCNLVNRFVLLVFFHRIFDKKTDFPLGSLRKVSSIEPPVVGRRSFCNLRLTYEASHPIACDGVVTDSGIPHFRVNTKVRSPSRSSFSHKMYHFAGALTYHARTVAGGVSALCCHRRFRELSELFGVGVCRSSVTCEDGVLAHPPIWLIGFPIMQRGRYSVEFYKVVQCTEWFTSRWYCLLGENKNRTSRPSGCQILWLSMSGYGHWEEY